MSWSRAGSVRLLIAAAAAFCTYFCMYAYRRPFTAGTFEGEEVFGLGLKTVVIIAQLIGYMLSKFIGIKVIAEMRREWRGWAILALIGFAELALVGFAYAPTALKPVMMFLNGLPLGMVFGLVLGFLEGRRQTEALSAALCASFIISSGVVKSVGRWLIEDWQVSEYTMPMLTGLIFTIPLIASVRVLQLTPPPDEHDRRLRSERTTMNRRQRQQFLSAYWPGMCLLVLVYVALTIMRTVRDDFAVELWRDLGVSKTPSVFARSETLVGLCVTALTALTIWIHDNGKALRVTIALMCAAFVVTIVGTFLQSAGGIGPFPFMVACGVGLYVPYVAFHTTVFERLIAASRRPCNLGFLMYVADAVGYLGYAVVMVIRLRYQAPSTVLPLFLPLLTILSLGSIAALLGANWYFHRSLAREAIEEENRGEIRPDVAAESASI